MNLVLTGQLANRVPPSNASSAIRNLKPAMCYRRFLSIVLSLRGLGELLLWTQYLMVQSLSGKVRLPVKGCWTEKKSEV